MSVLLAVQGLGKAFGPKPLFADLSFSLNAGERVGLIGPNGAGKSTLLRLLVGLEEPDTGSRSPRRGARIGYLAQDDVFPPGQSAREVLLAALEADAASGALEDHERETLTAITLTQVGFADHDVVAETLSGGWRKRLSLARELVLKPDLLLLDEPTNHLDLPGVIWLERLLRGARFSYLVATHDRAFLRAVADEILEISRVYPAGFFRVGGGYDTFLEKREEFLAGQAAREAATANKVRVETEWLGRKAAAQTRKAASRVEDALARREELADLKERNAASGAAGIDFVGTQRQSRKLLTARGLTKALGGRTLFSGVDIDLGPGMCLGLLGVNGSGKSTLLRLLAGTLAADAGEIVRAEGLRCVMFEQARAGLNTAVTLKKALCPIGDEIDYRGRPMHVQAWAKRFLFRQEQLEVPVSSLSGGEQARVRIAQLMTTPADVLMLDEPTNDLDIPALEALEESLESFPGAVVLVSHDRALMDRLCTEVIGLEEGGGAASFASVDQWLRAHERAQTQRAEAEKAASAASTAWAKKAAAPVKKKLSWNEQRELEGIEAAILAAEEVASAAEAAVEAAATKSHTELNAACVAAEKAKAEVERLYARWAELEAKK
jgi:ATP-binding cassette subfamily F protein uup